MPLAYLKLSTVTLETYSKIFGIYKNLVVQMLRGDFHIQMSILNVNMTFDIHSSLGAKSMELQRILSFKKFIIFSLSNKSSTQCTTRNLFKILCTITMTHSQDISVK